MPLVRVLYDSCMYTRGLSIPKTPEVRSACVDFKVQRKTLVIMFAVCPILPIIPLIIRVL